MFYVSSTISRLNPKLDVDDGANLGGGGGESSSSNESYLGLNSTPLRTFGDVAPFSDKVESIAEDTSTSSSASLDEGQGQEDVNQSSEGQLGGNETEQNQTQSLVFGRFKDLDQAETGYKNLQAHATRKAQEAAENAALASQLQARLAQLESQQNQTPSSSTETTGDNDEMSDDELELMLQDPKAFKEKLKSELLGEVKKVIEPDLKVAQQLRVDQEEQEAWVSKATEMIQAFDPTSGQPLYPDFLELKDEINKAFEMFPQFEKTKDFEAAIKVARMFKQQNAAPKPEDVLKDEKFINEKVVTDPNVQQKVLQQRLSEIKKGAPPPQINSSSGTSSPAQPTQKPKSMKEASRSFLARLGL